MKYAILLFVSIFFISMWLSIRSWQQDYFIRLNDLEYSFEEFFNEEISFDEFERLTKTNQLARIYDKLKFYICKIENCNMDLIEINHLESNLQKMIQEQFYFKILKDQMLIINKKFSARNFRNKLPWVGNEISRWQIILFAQKQHWHQADDWLKRLINNYPQLKIYFFPYISNLSDKVNKISCLNQRGDFWQIWNSDMFIQAHCDDFVENLSLDFLGLDVSPAFHIMDSSLNLVKIESNLDFFTSLHISYLLSKTIHQ